MQFFFSLFQLKSIKEGHKNFVQLKLRHFEKAAKLKKISLLFWRLLSKSADLSKQVGDFFKFLWPFQKAELLRVIQQLRGQNFAIF